MSNTFKYNQIQYHIDTLSYLSFYKEHHIHVEYGQNGSVFDSSIFVLESEIRFNHQWFEL